MKATRKSVLALIGAMAMGVAAAAPSVEILSVQQQYPWTNTVDITYEVAGVTNAEYFVRFVARAGEVTIKDVNDEESLQVALESNGTFVAQWYPQTNLQYTACTMTPSIFRGGSGGGDDYMVVDLDTGNVAYEPMATQEASNQKYQADAYKTRYMVLRRVPADTYYIGGPEDATTKIESGYNSYHAVSIPQDYYIAIYKLTEAQHDRLTGAAAPTNSTIPMRGTISFNTMRGSALSAATPTTGPIANLNAKTGLVFDLPTASMFEIAARAGNAGLYLSGSTTNNLAEYAWGDGKSDVTNVGTKKANAWGLYDMSGNVWEFTRDTWTDSDLAVAQPNGLVPIGSGTATHCIYKCPGGNMAFKAVAWRLSMVHKQTKANTYTWVGCRLAIINPRKK